MELSVRTAHQMYTEMMILMSMEGVAENSRNGEVLTLQEPLTVCVRDPLRRVVYDPLRMCNPFFHVMEFVWMMSGRMDAQWISQFNSRFVEYADSDGLIHGAYGNRWIDWFDINQILAAIAMLKEDHDSRRVVLAMWDAEWDLATEHNDLPCNTHIYLRIVDGKLNMTVCNRSNDVVWGMTGANIVHMTFLQELIASGVGVPVGKYYVVTNNAHVYTSLPGITEMLGIQHRVSPELRGLPLLQTGETVEVFLEDCRKFVTGSVSGETDWIMGVAAPIYKAYTERKKGKPYEAHVDLIESPDWQFACRQWLHYKNETSMLPVQTNKEST